MYIYFLAICKQNCAKRSISILPPRSSQLVERTVVHSTPLEFSPGSDWKFMVWTPEDLSEGPGWSLELCWNFVGSSFTINKKTCTNNDELFTLKSPHPPQILEEIIFQREMIDIFHHRTIATPWTHLDIGDVSFQKVDESTSNWTARDMWNFQWEKKKIKKVRMFFSKPSNNNGNGKLLLTWTMFRQ